MFHALAYQLVQAAAVTDNDMVAVQDDVFTRRGGAGGVDHFIFSEPYNALRAWVFGGTGITRARFNIPEWNALTRHQIFPVEASATIPDRPAGLDFRQLPAKLPVDEEVAVEVTNTTAGAATNMAVVVVAPPSWNMNLDRPREGTTVARATATVTLPGSTTPAWTTLTPITLTDGLRGGYYTLLGANVQGANNFAFRFHFPLSPYGGNARQLRPGGLVQNAVGDTPDPSQMGGYGNWGVFDSFELPQLQVLTTSGGTAANVIQLWLSYHGVRRPVSGR